MADRSHPAATGTMLRRLLPSLVLNGVVPLLAYTVIRPHVGGDAAALAIAGAVPVLVTAAGFLRRRRVDPFGVLAIAGFGIALLIAVLSGGNSFVLKLHDSVVTGPLGLVFLASLATRRPLLSVVKQLTMRDKGSSQPGDARAMYVLTGLVGSVLVLHAVVIVLLALTLPTSTFLAVGRPIGWVVMAAGAGVLFWYRGRPRITAA